MKTQAMKEKPKMAMKALRPRRVKQKDILKFDESVYAKVTLSNLVVYAIHYLLKQNIEIAMDDIVFACFRLFPQKFALKKYSRLPDSAVVGRHWHYCRSKKYIAANTDFGFKLTAKGVGLAEKVAKVLGVGTSKPKVKAKPSPIKARKEKAILPVTPQQTQPSQPKMPVIAPVKKVKVARKKKTISIAAGKQTQPSQPKPVVTPAKKVKAARKEKADSPVMVKRTQSPPRPKMPVVTHTKKTKVARKKKVVSPVTAKQPQRPQPKPVVTPTKKTKVTRKKTVVSPVMVKRTQSPPRPKTPVVTHTKKAKVTRKKKVVSPVAVKRTQHPQPKPAETPAKKAKVTWKVKPTPQPKPIWREKIIPPEPTVRAVSAQPQKANIPAQSNVNPEAKIRAGKFVRMMETSDAYVQYKKNGEKSNISEFDFRSLLLCTMESSSETLARNVEQFKGYANIHNRHDIIAFLDFCGDKFLHLLSPQKSMSKQKVKK